MGTLGAPARAGEEGAIRAMERYAEAQYCVKRHARGSRARGGRGLPDRGARAMVEVMGIALEGAQHDGGTPLSARRESRHQHIVTVARRLATPARGDGGETGEDDEDETWALMVVLLAPSQLFIEYWANYLSRCRSSRCCSGLAAARARSSTRRRAAQLPAHAHMTLNHDIYKGMDIRVGSSCSCSLARAARVRWCATSAWADRALPAPRERERGCRWKLVRERTRSRGSRTRTSFRVRRSRRRARRRRRRPEHARGHARPRRARAAQEPRGAVRGDHAAL